MEIPGYKLPVSTEMWRVIFHIINFCFQLPVLHMDILDTRYYRATDSQQSNCVINFALNNVSLTTKSKPYPAALESNSLNSNNLLLYILLGNYQF